MDPLNPFELNNWANAGPDMGGTGTGDDLEIGANNTPDDNDATLVQSMASNNFALGVWNLDHDHAVGLYGESDSLTGGIGTAGFCRKGVGSYGITEAGIGIAGRAMGQDKVEHPLDLQATAVGVFGQSKVGAAIRGHGGEFSNVLKSETTSPRSAGIGAVLSTGALSERPLVIDDAQLLEYSETAAPQLQLIPHVPRERTEVRLPTEGRIGEFFFFLDSRHAPHLYVCTGFRSKGTSGKTLPQWSPIRVEIQNALLGGDAVQPGQP
ncbi:hypothetical protein [Paraburkholderia caribensis]|uniref:hypothetical protein n=1 Tax=Paraburkholderia caribensis TaxID=75105 RepID=UPI0028545399|nr:hypothetical protein [Paraburkholderia caribensis]MDR6382151.1 hypothetical protein [Paraburkholderia caribensis]